MSIDLEAANVVATVRRLADRIRERFPEAHLNVVARHLCDVSAAAVPKIASVRKPNLFLRFFTVLMIAAVPASIGFAIYELGTHPVGLKTMSDFVAFFQAAVESLIFIGIGIAFLVTLEIRAKRNRALNAVHELRVLAHLIDMHQLDKDPVYILNPGPSTASSPKRTMTAFELNRYLDYCSEMLALVGKIAALYGRSLNDSVALSGIDQVESLTTGLSRKIWQKEMLLDRVIARS